MTYRSMLWQRPRPYVVPPRQMADKVIKTLCYPGGKELYNIFLTNSPLILWYPWGQLYDEKKIAFLRGTARKNDVTPEKRR